MSEAEVKEIAPWARAIASAEPKFAAIAAVDGNMVTYQREAMFAMQAIGGSDALRSCDPHSIRNAVINVASVGLTINPAMKLAYLVPRKGECCLDISYIGLVKIATDSGSVLAVKADVVCSNDRFEYHGPFSMPGHTFDPFASRDARGEVIGAYAIAKLSSGFMAETLSREELDKIRAMSKAKSGPWFDWFEEMAKKAVIKRASKMWPRTERLAQAETILNEHEGLAVGRFYDGYVDPEYITQEQELSLIALLEETGADKQKFISYFGIIETSKLPATSYENAMRMAEERRQK